MKINNGYFDEKLNSLMFSHDGINMANNFIYTYGSSKEKFNYFDTTSGYSPMSWISGTVETLYLLLNRG